MALVLVGKALTKVGSDLLVKSIIDRSLIGHSVELYKLLLGRQFDENV